MNLTARAFRVPALRLWTLPNDKALHQYAEYTRDNLKSGPSEELLLRMRDEALKVGRRLRFLCHLRRQADIEQFIIALYRHIGIDLKCQIPGRLCFRHCFFSHYYTPEICLAASALDEGIIAGLSGGGHLQFQQRITEGCPQCIAIFSQTTKQLNAQTTKRLNTQI